MKYMFRIEITLDDEKILNDGEYELNNVYQTIIDFAKENHLTRLKAKDEKTLLFGISGNHKDDLAYIALFEDGLLNSDWFRKCVANMIWYEEDEGDVIKEDIIKSYDDFMARNGL